MKLNENSFAIMVLKKEFLRLSQAYIPKEYEGNLDLFKEHKKELLVAIDKLQGKKWIKNYAVSK